MLGVDDCQTRGITVGHVGGETVIGERDLVMSCAGRDKCRDTLIAGIDDRDTALLCGLSVVPHPQITAVILYDEAGRVVAGVDVLDDFEGFQIDHCDLPGFGHADIQIFFFMPHHPVFTSLLEDDHSVELGNAGDAQDRVDNGDGVVVIHDQHVELVQVDIGLKAERPLQVETDLILAGEVLCDGGLFIQIDPDCWFQRRDRSPGHRIADAERDFGDLRLADAARQILSIGLRADGKLDPYALLFKTAGQRFSCGLQRNGGRGQGMLFSGLQWLHVPFACYEKKIQQCRHQQATQHLCHHLSSL